MRALLLLLPAALGCAQPAGTFETVELHAEAVDQVYTLRLFEPDAAVEGGHVVYLFDGDDWTREVAFLVSDLAAEGVTPPRVVGIGYGDRTNHRARDLTPAGPGVPDGWGEVAAFTAFLTDELVPWVDARFPSAPEAQARTVLGHSFGGAASMHVLLAASETFGNAIILSPSLGLGEGVLFEQEADYAADHDDLPAQAYLSAGELEAHGLAGMTQEMGRILAGRGHPSMRVRTELVPRTVHADVFPIAAEDGLRFVLGER